MRYLCREITLRSSRRLHLTSGLLRHARIVSDPKKLAQLYAEAEKWKCYAREERTKAEQH
jgi:hypothetical protein